MSGDTGAVPVSVEDKSHGSPVDFVEVGDSLSV